jgi:SEL1 protein
MSSLFPNHQGPIATAIRILGTLRQQSWLPRFLAKKLNGKRWGSKQTDSQKARATKAIELLEFAAEAGHKDALYKLAQISLVRSPPSFVVANIEQEPPQVPPIGPPDECDEGI